MKRVPSKPAPKSAPKKSDTAQSDRFIATAKKIGADESPTAFDRAFGKVAKAKKGKH